MMRTWDDAKSELEDPCRSHPGIECELETVCSRENGCDHCKQVAHDYERHHLDGVRADVLRHLNDFASEHRLSVEVIASMGTTFKAQPIHMGTTSADWGRLIEKIADVIK